MKHFIQWSGPGFRELEQFPERKAFGILQRTDLLSTFPELGSDLGSRFPELSGLRQLIIDRLIRVIYEFDKVESTVWILSVQHCRQKLPTASDLKRRRRIE